MKKMVIGAVAALFSVSALAHNICVKVDEAQIEKLFDRWNAALQTGDSAKLDANYRKDAVLLPTVSGIIRTTDVEREAYFKDFLKKHPVGSTIDSRKIFLGCNSAVDVGDYTFVFADKSTLPARYTYTYGWDGKEWLITSHHSSVRPAN